MPEKEMLAVRHSKYLPDFQEFTGNISKFKWTSYCLSLEIVEKELQISITMEGKVVICI